MPWVRGRLIPEIEQSGRAKEYLDIVLWTGQLQRPDIAALDELGILSAYLLSLDPFVCWIRLWVPEGHLETTRSLHELGIAHRTIPARSPAEITERIDSAEPELLAAIATAQAVDADCLAITNRDWLPFAEDVNRKLSLLITDFSFLLPYSERFSRGHDIPWAFAYKEWWAPWIAFYQLSERQTFQPGMQLLQRAQEKKVPADAVEACRSLVLNRLANLCFTRDRLFFYEMEQMVSKRNGWKRQRFSFEISYFLNFYYLLIFGIFDHAALFISQLLALGLADRQVGARSPAFLLAMEKRSPSLHAIFSDKSTTEFLDRIAYLRHYAAHRGTVTPTMVVEAPEQEPTNEELDEDIRNAGLDYILHAFPEGPDRNGYQNMLRTNARAARYEKHTILEDVVPIEVGGTFGFINPLMDTSWNFSNVLKFLNSVYAECMKLLA
jgi:hypothetical protein